MTFIVLPQSQFISFMSNTQMKFYYLYYSLKTIKKFTMRHKVRAYAQLFPQGHLPKITCLPPLKDKPGVFIPA